MAAADTVHDFHDTDYFFYVYLRYIHSTCYRIAPDHLEPPMDYTCIRLLLAFL